VLRAGFVLLAVDTEAVDKRSDADASDLETIDLGGETEEPQTPPARRASRRPTIALVLVSAAVVIAGLSFLAIRSGHHGSGSAENTVPRTSLSPIPTTAPPPVRSTEPLLGRFYPVLDRRDATRIVMPTGLTFTLSGHVSTAIGGLGATFLGTVRPKGATCCAVSFEILHAAPSDLFAMLGPSPISTPVLVSSARAVQPDLRQTVGRFGILSTGDWTLIASYENADHSKEADAVVRTILGSWHLRATPYGAIVQVPAGATVDNSEVDFGSVPDLTDQAVDFVKSEPCQIGPTPAFFGTAADTTGRWCDHGLAVTIEGPRPYVQRAVANLEVTLTTEAATSRGQ
jgi:hypothetical protein